MAKEKHCGTQPDLPAWAVTAALALLLVISCLGLDRGLWTPDEPREAELSREMLLAPGVIPTLNGAPFVEKPPLYYWTVAAAFGLTGGPSALVARAVSAAAAFATLMVVFFWGRRAHSTAAGLAASILLATSLQFMLTAHWVLMDPMLMAFTTGASWAAWELLHGPGGGTPIAILYLALTLALWTKGLIGPVLIGSGLAAYSAIERRWPGRALRLGLGTGVAIGAVAALALAIYLAGGRRALWEWAWVNHVQRFVHPDRTGHDQPLFYYLWTLPFALLPWLVPLANFLRPDRWRRDADGAGLRRYCAVMAGAMVVVLSAAATKRGTYLMPVLPLICMALAIDVLQWQGTRPDDAGLGRWATVQAALLACYALAPPIAMIVYLRRPDPLALLFLAAALAVSIALVAATRHRGTQGAMTALVRMAACSLVAAIGFLVLVPRALDREKDMAPFLAALDERLPAGIPLPAVGADETLLAIVPFVTGRAVVPLEAADILALGKAGRPRPPFLLVQLRRRGQPTPDLGDGYTLAASQAFGPDRRLALFSLPSPLARPRSGGQKSALIPESVPYRE